MLLRTRIMIIVLIIVAFPMAVMGFAFLHRDSEMEERLDVLHLESQQTVFNQAIGSILRAAQAATTALLQEPGITQAVINGDRETLGLLEARIRQAAAGAYIERIDIFVTGGDLLYSTDVSFFAQAVLEDVGWSFTWLDTPTYGARILDGQLIGIAAAPILIGDKRIGTSVTTVGFDDLVQNVADLLGASIFVIDRQGARIFGKDGDLWQAIAPAIEARNLVGEIVTVEADGRLWQVGGFALADVGGGATATVLVATDVTEESSLRGLRNAALVASIVIGALLVLGLLYAYLRGALRPLDDGIEALNALSAGNTDHYAELPSGGDEVGQIGRAIDVFRTVALSAERAAEERERRRRRQTRFIRRQMAMLSETLDEEAKEAALEDLKEIDAAAEADRAARARGEGGDELGVIAVALERMTGRVREQQDRLSDLVARLREALAAKTRLISLEQELDIARGMQQSILPRTFPPFGDFEFDARMTPAREVGGDFYDVFRIDEQRLGVVVADVSGKGIPAAFFMLISRTLMKAVGQSGETPAGALERLNDLLSAENEQMLFVTAFYGVLDRSSGQISFANAGHNPPIVRRADGSIEWLSEHAGIALAAMPELDYETASVTLQPGDSLLLYTDGVTEAMDPDGALFGEERLATTVAAANSGVSDLLTRTFDAVRDFAAGEPQADDLTALAVYRRMDARDV